jgi:hypothetical protein
MAGWLSSLDCCRDRAALLMPENYDQLRTQVLDCVLDAAEDRVIGDVSSHSDYKQIAQALIKQQLRRDSRVRAAQNHCKWMLSTD